MPQSFTSLSAATGPSLLLVARFAFTATPLDIKEVGCGI